MQADALANKKRFGSCPVKLVFVASPNALLGRFEIIDRGDTTLRHA